MAADVDFQVLAAVLDGCDVDVIGQFGIVVDHVLIKFDSFGPDHHQIALVLEQEVDGRVNWEVLVDHDVLDQMVVLRRPDLHDRLGVHRDDDLVLFGTLHVHQGGLVTFQPSHWVLQVGVPDEDIKVETARHDQFVVD